MSKEDNTELGRQIAAGIAEGMKALAPQKVTVGQYMKRAYSAFHDPEKGGKRAKLLRECYDNNFQLHVERLHDNEIELLNRIRRPGHYLNRKVEVVIKNLGGDISEEVVFLRYNNRTPDHRMANAQLWRDFPELLTKIVAEQTAAEEKDAQRNAPASKA